MRTASPETVKYQLLAPMLLNEVQKQQRTIEAQVQQIAAQAAEIESQAGQLADLQARLIRLETLSRRSLIRRLVRGKSQCVRRSRARPGFERFEFPLERYRLSPATLSGDVGRL